MNGAGGVHVHHGASTPPADRSNAGVANNDSPYVVHVSLKFILLGLFSTALLAFSVGRAARIILLEGPRRALFAPHDHSSLRNRPDYHEAYATRSSLPPPIARKGRPIPKTVYTAKNFDTARTATSASLLLQRNEDKDEDNEAAFYPLFDACEEREDGSKQCSRGQKPADYPIDEEQEEDDDPSSQKESTTGDEEEDEEEHLPAGQHLLVDMKGVDGAFLNSEKRLADAMVEVVNEASLTLLSYHCHKLLPAGVSCVGVLLESHVSFHTWPTEGVITLDLYTCGSNPLVPVMPIIEHLFGIPRIHAKTGEPDTVETKWWHKLRGFRPKRSNPLQSYDLGVSILGSAEVEMKNTVRIVA
jgi:S-adenosylmethionine decarboxylase proenzyme